MALLSKPELSVKFSVPTNQLSVMITRALKKDKIIMQGEYMDDANPLNQQWINKYSLKGAVKSKIKGKEPSPATQSQKEVTNYSVTLFEQLEKKKAELQNKEIEGKVLKLELQNKKMMGESIPTENVKLLIIQLSEAINLSWENELETMLVSIGAKYGITREEMAVIKKDKNNAANIARTRAIQNAKTMLRRLQAENADKRERGQHG